MSIKVTKADFVIDIKGNQILLTSTEAKDLLKQLKELFEEEQCKKDQEEKDKLQKALEELRNNFPKQEPFKMPSPFNLPHKPYNPKPWIDPNDVNPFKNPIYTLGDKPLDSFMVSKDITSITDINE